MIVRTYGRRSRAINDVVDGGGGGCGGSLSQEEAPPSQDIYGFGFSSQDSSPWSFDSDPFAPSESELKGGGDGGGKEKKARNGRRNGGLPAGKPGRMGCSAVAVAAGTTKTTTTATLMETQEFGEMMEHVDEVNFALDGLRSSQPVRIRRASLASLLSICDTPQKRRLLRTQGMAKTIIDAILGLNFDDSPSNLAAAALFYILTSDGQDDHLLESPNSIHFLQKLLKPFISDSSKSKAPTIGLKLLGLRKVADNLQEKPNSVDSSSTALIQKVQDILVKCKELMPGYRDGSGLGRPELSPKWIALLTMEKASLTTVSLEETTGTVRKTGGNFKEKLRELGGLDTVFDVLLDCRSLLERRLRSGSPMSQNKEVDSDAESLVLLLKSLKIMENATFLSKDNQSHLLGMRGNSDHQESLSFTELIVSLIEILSGLFLRKSNAFSSEAEKHDHAKSTVHTVDLALVVDRRAEGGESSSKCFSMERASSEKTFSLCQNSRWLSTVRLRNSESTSETSASSVVDSCLLKMRIDSSTSSSCSLASRSLNSEQPFSKNGLKKNSILGKRPIISEETTIDLSEDSQDPFAFDEDDFKPSKWELLSVSQKPKASRARKRRVIRKELENGFQSQLMMSQQESSSNGSHHSLELTSLDTVDAEIVDLLADCLLTAVKVLMNLTNDNPIGCQQIAACGGLETMSSLIACHFPLFSSFPSPCTETRENKSSQSTIELDNQHLTEQQLDFLVAILGLLVNLVEKDSHNRSRLAAASVLLPSQKGLHDGGRRDVIPLLCCVFLANRGAGDVTDEGNLLGNDEAALLLGEKEAEQTIIEAYAALLLAFLSTESKSIRNAIAERLPEQKVSILVPVLERFLAFHLTLDMISPETHRAVSEVIESCRLP